MKLIGKGIAFMIGTERITVAKISTSQTYLSSQACSIKFIMGFFTEIVIKVTNPYAITII